MSNVLPNLPPQSGLSYPKRLLFAALLPGIVLTGLFLATAYLYLAVDTPGSGSGASGNGAGIEILLLLVIFLPIIGGLTTQLLLVGLIAMTFVPWKRNYTAFFGGLAAGAIAMVAGFAISKMLFGHLPIWPRGW